MDGPKIAKIYDPAVGAQYLSVADAAKYLNYLEFSVRRLIFRGKLKPHGKIGNKWMFLKEELDRYKASNPWAARKAGHGGAQELPPAAPSDLRAEVRIHSGLGPILGGPTEVIEKFTWQELPLIRARTHSIHGDVPFEVVIRSPDGASWQVDFQPPTWFEKAWQRVKGV